MEIIEQIAALLASIAGKSGGEQALQKFIELLIFVTLLVLAAFARPLALKVSLIRRMLDKGDKFSGRYVQIINSENQRRYSVLDIRYKSYRRGYYLTGIQYDTEGRRAIDFDSENVAFREAQNDYFEFVWRAETVTTKDRFDGYTQMRPDDSNNLDMLEGRGFFITFHNEPKRFDLRFVKLTKKRLKALGLDDPKTEKDRVAFVKGLHLKLRDHPHIQPIEESGSPLL
jgi:hypothetical protein